MKPILELREFVDVIDDLIVSMLDERARIVAAIFEMKRTLKIPVYDPAREREVVRRAIASSDGMLAPSSIETIFQTIMATGRNGEEAECEADSRELSNGIESETISST